MKLLIFLLVIFALSGCADNVNFKDAEVMTRVGFFYGLWHGMIFPLAWIVSLFSDSTTVYAIYNNGGWYNFGFMLGISSAFGGSAKARK